MFRMVRDPESKVHNVVEYNVTVLLEGAIETRCAPPPTHNNSISELIGNIADRNSATPKRTMQSSSRQTQVRSSLLLCTTHQ